MGCVIHATHFLFAARSFGNNLASLLPNWQRLRPGPAGSKNGGESPCSMTGVCAFFPAIRPPRCAHFQLLNPGASLRALKDGGSHGDTFLYLERPISAGQSVPENAGRPE